MVQIIFDRAPASTRSYDQDGRLRASVRISKAAINPYQGREVPDFETLGLDPDRTYQLLRHPDELREAVASFRGIPLLSSHRALDAGDHERALVVGTVGTDVEFENPYLVATVVIWDQEAIDLVETGERSELSCGYRYTPDMTAGVFQGQHYDGVMRDLVGNHVALVEAGRAGSDCAL